MYLFNLRAQIVYISNIKIIFQVRQVKIMQLYVLEINEW